MTVSKNQEHINTIKWIEKGILEHTLSDHRKYIIWRILSPYLLNVKKLPKEEAYSGLLYNYPTAMFDRIKFLDK
jgi:hypothetical protein